MINQRDTGCPQVGGSAVRPGWGHKPPPPRGFTFKQHPGTPSMSNSCPDGHSTRVDAVPVARTRLGETWTPSSGADMTRCSRGCQKQSRRRANVVVSQTGLTVALVSDLYRFYSFCVLRYLRFQRVARPCHMLTTTPMVRSE